MADLFGNESTSPLPLKNRSGSFNINPCLAAFGNGPDGEKCKNCVHLLKRSARNSTFYKCEKRKITSSVASDHRVNWSACGQFKAKEAEGGLEIDPHNLEKIKAELVAGKHITVRSVLLSVGTQELRTYISQLKRQGMHIASTWVKRRDKKFKEYYLESA
jgi:hypothetical protein